MKVLLLSTHLNTGGIARYIVTLAKGLKQYGHEVTVATSGGDMVTFLEDSGIHHLTINVRTKSELDPRIYWALRPLSKFIRENRVDVIHAQTRVTQVMGTFLKRLTRTPYVSTCHGYFKIRLARKLFNGWGDKVIAISEAVKIHLVKDLKIPDEKVVLVHNGIDFSQFQVINEDMRNVNRKKFNLGQEPVIGIIARLANEKGHVVLIEAMKKILTQYPRAKLFIVGKGKLEGILKKKVKELNLKDYIYFYPVVNETAEMLSLLDVFVMPSLAEGFGLSILEAMAAGVPVVATNVGGIPSIVNDGITGLLVPPQNADALASAVIIMLKHKDRSQLMSREAQRFIDGKFSVEKMVEGTLKVYESSVEQKQ